MSARAVRHLAAFAALGATAIAGAQQPAAGVLTWDCVQTADRAFHARCSPLVGAGPQPAVLRADADAAALPPPLPGRPDMRPVAQRGPEAVADAEPWLVPLHAAPTDRAFAIAMLESVLCGKHPACRVDYRDAGTIIARR